MSTKVQTKVLEGSGQEGTRLFVLLVLAYRANDQGHCWPSVTKIADDTRLSPRQVKRVLKDLEEAGELHVPPGARSPKNPYTVLPAGDIQGLRGDIGPSDHAQNGTSGGDISDVEGGTLPAGAHVERTAVEGKEEQTHEQGAVPSARERANADIYEVWRYYLAKVPSRRQLGLKQRSQIKAALKVRTIDEIKLAIDGLAASPFHNGINDRDKTYLDLHYAIVARGLESTEERIDKAIAWGKRLTAASMEKSVRDRLLEEVRFTYGLEHHPESARADAAVAQLKAAGYKIVAIDQPPWALLELA
jgi:hypothetical protein